LACYPDPYSDVLRRELKVSPGAHNFFIGRPGRNN
jgi:hypothetical protein